MADKEVKEAIEIVENALMFYAEEGISSDKKAQKELDNAWNIVKETTLYTTEDAWETSSRWIEEDKKDNPDKYI